MNYELFLAKRIIAGKEHKNSISSPIIKIAITAIVLGIVVMLISVSTGAGLQEKIREKTSGFKGHIQITSYDNNNSQVSIFPIDKNQGFYPNFNDVSGVKNIQIYANKTGLIRTKNDFEGVVMKGVSTDYDWSFFKEYLIEGQLPDFYQKRNKQVLLSKTLTDKLNLKLNDTILVSFLKTINSKIPSNRKYIISGIYNTDFLDFDKNMMIGDIREVQKLNNWTKNQVGGFEVLLNDFDQLRDKTNQIYRVIGSELDARNIANENPAIFEWIDLFDNNIWFIIAIMVLVSGINMITALLVLILEKVQTIGILKALGSSNWSIRKIFLYNATYLILRGLFWGNIIGFSLLLIQYYTGFITLDPENYYVTSVPIHFNILSTVFLNLGTLILCFVMMIVPSVIITKIKPSKSIKFT